MNPKKFKKVIFNLYWNPVVVLKKISLFCMSLIFDVVHFFLKAAKRMLVISKNPKIILISFLKTFKKTKNFIKNLPKLSIEYFFLMVMSAENNIHRFKRKNIADIPHLSEIKNYQKNLRKKTFKFVFTGAMAIMLIISLPGLFQKYLAQSKGYQWIQTNWTGAGDTNAKITSSSNWSNWTNYYSKSSADLEANGASGIALHQYTASNVTETGGSYSGPLDNGSGMYAIGDVLRLKKPVGAPCGSGVAGGDSIGDDECVSGFCATTTTHLCIPSPWVSGPCGTASFKVYYTEQTYGLKWRDIWGTTACASPQCSGNFLVDETFNSTVTFDGSQNDSTGKAASYPARQECKNLNARLPSTAELACIYTNRATYATNGVSFAADNTYYFWSNENLGGAFAKSYLFHNSGSIITTTTKSSTTNHTFCVKGVY